MEAWLPTFNPHAAVAHASKFSETNFRANFLNALEGFATDSSGVARRAISDARARAG